MTEIFDEKERSVTGTSVKHEIGQQVWGAERRGQVCSDGLERGASGEEEGGEAISAIARAPDIPTNAWFILISSGECWH
jgi:hypothetical protein